MASLNLEQYQIMDEIDHILKRPGILIGDIERTPRITNFFSVETNQMISKTIDHPQGQQHLFLEVLGNAGDNVERSRDHKVEAGDIHVAMNSNTMVVQNTGMFIPIVKYADPKIDKWLPETQFGMLRAGSNFNDKDPNKSKTIGANGYGVKLVNIFSKFFNIVCTDPERKLMYQQTWTNNMKQCSNPEITPYDGPAFVRVTYQLEFERFGSTCFEPDSIGIYMANCAELACAKKVAVHFNQHTFKFKDLVDYSKLFFPITKKNAVNYNFSSPEGSYEVCICDTPDKAIVQSFVNGIITREGGVHVEAIYKNLVDSISAELEKHLDGIKLTKRDVVNHVSVFIACNLANPKWGAQVKDSLKGLGLEKGSDFKIEIPEKQLKHVQDWELIKIIFADIQRKQSAKLKKKDGKRTRKTGIESLDDANWAATKNFRQTILVMPEGESGSAYPTKFRDLMPNGCDRLGILPLQGKLLNVLNARFTQILENKELDEINKSLGLKSSGLDYKDPKNFSTLRYGSVLLMPDADEDGLHILGLILLYFILNFPSLIEIGFVQFMRTPVVRVDYHGQKFKFFTMTSFRRWLTLVPPTVKFAHEDIDYFKGLGSCEDFHIAEDYTDPKIATFQLDVKAQERIVLAFHKEAADHRKAWITNWVDQEVLGFENLKEVPISQFVDQELIKYSFENVIRAIPEAMDGMKDSQRKAFYAILKKLKKKSTKKMGDKAPKLKIEQISNYAASVTNYKHGANSLSDTMFRMARNFVGANNLPLLTPRAQLGTRKKGGKDGAASRYAYVGLPEWINLMFRKEDELILKNVVDEGEAQEYENFFPILPIHVINGIKGVGTAWSTSFPGHNPLDVAFWIQQRLAQILEPDRNHQLPKIRPWYKGFTGDIIPTKEGFSCHGKFMNLPNGKIQITELPIGRWTKKYTQMLDEMEEAGMISGYENRSKANTIDIIIDKFLDGAPTLSKLKLIKKLSYSNLTVLYRDANREIRPRTYHSIVDLLQDFVALRLGKYEERKTAQIKKFQEKILDLTERARFILLVVEKKIKILKRNEADVYRDMDEYKLDHKWYGKVRANEFSNERWLSLQEQIKKQQIEMEMFSTIPTPRMWYNEIEEFLVYYCKSQKVPRSTFESCDPPIPVIADE